MTKIGSFVCLGRALYITTTPLCFSFNCSAVAYVLEIEFRQREVVIELAWDEDDNYRCENCLSWESFEFCFKEQEFTHSCSEFLSCRGFEDLKIGRKRERYNRATGEREEEIEHKDGLNIDQLNDTTTSGQIFYYFSLS